MEAKSYSNYKCVTSINVVFQDPSPSPRSFFHAHKFLKPILKKRRTKETVAIGTVKNKSYNSDRILLKQVTKYNILAARLIEWAPIKNLYVVLDTGRLHSYTKGPLCNPHLNLSFKMFLLICCICSSLWNRIINSYDLTTLEWIDERFLRCQCMLLKNP